MIVLILGGGASSGDTNETPVWLAERDGQVLVERFVTACAGLRARLVFAVRTQDAKRFRLDNVIRLAAPNAAIVPIGGETMGAACTALLCIEKIELDDELLILNSNELLAADYGDVAADFRARGLDAGLVVFPSLHPRYSYVQLDDDGMIVEAAEKNPISRNATAGFYWFRRGADFIAAAQAMIRKDAQVDDRFFISLVFNELVLEQRRLGVFQIDASQYLPLKSRQQMAQYEAGVDTKAMP